MKFAESTPGASTEINRAENSAGLLWNQKSFDRIIRYSDFCSLFHEASRLLLNFGTARLEYRRYENRFLSSPSSL